MNYISWKYKNKVNLEDYRVKEFICNDIPKPATTYTQDLVAWKKNVVKERRIYWKELKIIFSQTYMERKLHMKLKKMKREGDRFYSLGFHGFT